MLFHFSDYQFDAESKLLKRNDFVVPLNDKPAELLALFIAESDTIHSKNDILDKVWAGRVVTDQVVFQNINTLRGLFGHQAIKTFPKKGYQWQLPVTQEDSASLDETSPPDSPLNEEAVSSRQSTMGDNTDIYQNKSKRLMTKGLSARFAWFVVLLLLTGLVIDQLPSKDNNAQGPYWLISSAESIQTKTEGEGLNHAKHIEQPHWHQQMFDSPFQTWRQLARENEKVFAVKTYVTHSGTVLRFQIQGARRGWHGYIKNKNQTENIKKLNWLLSRLAETEFFDVGSDYEALAGLTLLQSRYPTELLLIHQIAELNFRLDSLDRAIAITENQLAVLKDDFYLGVFHQLNAKINTWNQNWQRGKESNEQALRIFSDLGLAQLTAEAFIQEAWVKYYHQENRQSMQSLNKAVKQARLAGEPLQEVNAHLVQAFLASKLGQKAIMHNQIDLANQLIDMHKLHEEHQVAMQYYRAWGEEDTREKLAIYQSLLSMPFSELYSHFQYAAAEIVRDTYIGQGEMEQAKFSMQTWQRSSFVALSQAHIANASGNTKEAVEKAIEAFRQAQIAQELRDALDAALLLVSMSHQNTDMVVANSDTYLNYIRQNSSHRWLNQNSATLKALGILKHVTPI